MKIDFFSKKEHITMLPSQQRNTASAIMVHSRKDKLEQPSKSYFKTIINYLSSVFSALFSQFKRVSLFDIWKETLQKVQQGKYKSKDGKVHTLDLAVGIQSVQSYQDAGPIGCYEEKYRTNICVINRDSIDEGKRLLELGMNPVVLNMANETSPGGGVKTGSLAEEEICCRRSTLLPILDQSLGLQPKQLYPLRFSAGCFWMRRFWSATEARC